MPESTPLPGPELLSIPPRAVEYRPKAFVFRAVFFGILFAFAVLAAAFGIQDNRRLRELQSNGVPVNGVVTGEYIKGANPSYYHVYYGYTIAGQYYSGESRVSETTYMAAQIGGPAVIYVLRGDPSYSNMGPVTSAELDQQPRYWFILEVLGILTFGYMAFGIDVYFRAQYKLLRDGVTAEAKITQIFGGKSSSNATVKCTYETAQGPITRGFNTTGRSVAGLGAGSTVTVIYNPAKPKQGMLYKDIRMVTVV